jgi:CBS domain-containing protein
MSVGKICHRDVDLADTQESVWKAAERMLQRNVGTLVILDSREQPLGIITDRDLVTRVMAANKNPHTTTVGEIMTIDPATIRENTSIEVALGRMQGGVCRRMLVVDEDGRLVGVLSLDDVMLLLGEEMSEIVRLLERETPRAVATSSRI